MTRAPLAPYVQNLVTGMHARPTAVHVDQSQPQARPRSQPASWLQTKRSGDPTDTDPSRQVPGMPPNFGEWLTPHVITFQGIVSSVARVYRASDEAIKHSFENARFMRNDPAVMECIEQRMRSTALLDWHLEPDDENDPIQKMLCEELTTIIKRIPRFMQYREQLMQAIWYGKYGVQHRFAWQSVKGKMRVVIDRTLPVNGDKIVFRFDDGTGDYDPDQVGIRVGAGFTTAESVARRWSVDRVNKIEPTDYGLAYFLEEWERDLLAIHKHMIEDGEYEDPQNAGRVHGVGIRSRIYWLWYQKQEALAWLMEYLERSAFGIEIWYYPYGNKEAEEKTRTAAEERIGLGRNIILVPKVPGESSMDFGVERIEPGFAGVDAVKSLCIEYFGHLMKRYILGQVLTTEAQATGLGSNLASVHLDTYLQIVRYDALNLEETLTTETVQPLQKFNFPKYADVPIHFRIDTEAPDIEGKLAGWKQAFDMGVRLKESDVLELIGTGQPEEGDVVLQDPTHKQAEMQQQQMAQMQQAGMGGVAGGGGNLVQGIGPLGGNGEGGIGGVSEPSGVEEPAKFDAATGDPISETSERMPARKYTEGELEGMEGLELPGVKPTATAVEEEETSEKEPLKEGMQEAYEEWEENQNPEEQVENGKPEKPLDFAEAYAQWSESQLTKGREVEKEHTDNPAVAEKIATDHLEEDPKYYDQLKLIEEFNRGMHQYGKYGFTPATDAQREAWFASQQTGELLTIEDGQPMRYYRHNGGVWCEHYRPKLNL